MKKPNIVIAGDAIFAGIDEDDITKIKNSLVVEFPDSESFRLALRTGKIDATVFGIPDDCQSKYFKKGTDHDE